MPEIRDDDFEALPAAGIEMKRYKNIQVHEDTFKAFKEAVKFLSQRFGKKVTHDKLLMFLLMDFEAMTNAPKELRLAAATHGFEYWARRGMECDNSL